MVMAQNFLLVSLKSTAYKIIRMLCKPTNSHTAREQDDSFQMDSSQLRICRRAWDLGLELENLV